MRGPGRFASPEQVADRVRRLPSDALHRREAKRIVKDNPLEALRILRTHGDVSDQHVEAYKRWVTKDLL